jgi:two-component system sensor histidine kinase DesK
MTNVTCPAAAAEAQSQHVQGARMSSHAQPVRKHVPWGFLVWTLPLAYVFWEPYQQRADSLEWVATGLALAAVLALFLAGLTFAENRRRVAAICIALLLIAVGFLAYRPSGALYFPVAAAFVPAAVAGRIGLSMALVIAVAGLFGAEWLLLHSDGSQGAILPLFAAAQTLVSGAGAIAAVRQTHELQRRDKASERERIAQDLHDVLGHSLSSLALKAELARRVFHTDPKRALLEIGDVERIARQGLEEVRGVVHGYHSGDINAELDRVESLLQAADFHVERRCDDLDMPPAQERVLALIVREAVTNILRHSQAKTCRLALFREAEVYRLEISDDGCGGKLDEGIGMRSIRTRAEAFGGTAVWSTSSGTRMSVSLPVSGLERG